MAELRAGGLAIIVGGNPETFGIVVTTEALIPNGGVIALPNGKGLRNGGSTRWLVHSDRLCLELSNGTIIDDYCLMPSRCLMPIDGDDFTHEDEREKELVNG